ncbi:MAG: NAD-dependent epimerase/dehydratase family protein [Acidobacteriota bacterium]|nr:NAD-dependent epimerase/dehydratase family protein [Acidobacteriota bacterium]MDH3784273.1 NAD-dependent epimerase/dehydratase family protein [Acidobacteriota bacterium]
MSDKTVLVTGAAGEMGQLLIPRLTETGHRVVALDLSEIPAALKPHTARTVKASVLDGDVLDTVFRDENPQMVFHLAAILSSKAEKDPLLAHQVNVDGTFQLFRLCTRSRRTHGRPVRFLFPSSIAVYGFPSRLAKRSVARVHEHQWTLPIGMYGCNKLYGEATGNYLSRRAQDGAPLLDFRAIRFPGLVSAATLPSGGTTDYAPEMIHAAASGKPYSCFVDADTRLPFMTMPDGVDALLRIAAAEPASLTQRIYNIGAFSASAAELRDECLRHFPDAQIGFASDLRRQSLVDSWPRDVDDSAARADWGHRTLHGLHGALEDYLVPALRERYRLTGA